MNLRVSRVTTRTLDTADPPIDSPWPIGYNKSQIRDYQIADEDISHILVWKTESDSRPMGKTVAKFSPATRNLWLSWNFLEIQDGILYFRQFMSSNSYSSKKCNTPNNSQFNNGRPPRNKENTIMNKKKIFLARDEGFRTHLDPKHTCAQNMKPRKTRLLY